MTNKEIGKTIWNELDITGYYAEDFESWYEDYFAEYMEKAADAIWNGNCKYETGSFIEIGSYWSKTGNPVLIDFEKENFIEFYGEDKCRELFQPERQAMAKCLEYLNLEVSEENINHYIDCGYLTINANAYEEKFAWYLDGDGNETCFSVETFERVEPSEVGLSD